MGFFDFLTGNNDDKRRAKTMAKAWQEDLMDRSHEIYNDTRSRMQDIATSPGYSDPEKRDIRMAATAPIAGAYGAAQGQLQNRAALTGNSTGLIPATQAFARAKARDMSMAAAGTAKDIGDKRIQGTQFAAQGLIPMYAPALAGATDVTMGQFGEANKPGWLRSIVTNAAGAVGGALAGKV